MKLSISMTRREFFLGWGYLILSMFGLPFLIGWGSALLKQPVTEAVANIVYFAVNFLFVAIIFHRFLFSSLKAAVKTPWRCLRFAFLGLLIYYGASLVLAQIILRVDPEFANINDSTLMEMTQEHYSLMSFCTIFLVPVTEETFYRGLLFQNLQRKSRILAYILSSMVFAAIHVMGYIGSADTQTLLLCYLQYLPAGLSLAWAYEKADTIIAPMLMHITINQIAMSAMSVMR